MVGRKLRAGMVVLALSWLSGPTQRVFAQSGPQTSPFDPTSTTALAGSLRGYLVQHLPHVLYEDTRDWGEMKLVPRGLEWTGKKRIKLRPSIQYSHKNHGVWRKVRITSVNPRDTLIFDLRDVNRPAPGCMTFVAFVSFDARVEYNQQNWRSGIRLYSGSVRARMRVRLAVLCEVISRVEKSSTFVPDVVFRLRVVRSDLGYDNFVVEHIAGVGGELAELLGNAVRGGLHQWRPGLERNMLDRANAAIVKAGHTREVRISLGKLLEGKGGVANLVPIK